MNNDENFLLYVQGFEAKEEMLRRGYQLMKVEGDIYIFANDDRLTFDLDTVPAVESNVLSF